VPVRADPVPPVCRGKMSFFAAGTTKIATRLRQPNIDYRERAQRTLHLFYGGNFKVYVLQLVMHRHRWIKQLESNIALFGPSLQKH
jgi:hypothetical protein